MPSLLGAIPRTKSSCMLSFVLQSMLGAPAGGQHKWEDRLSPVPCWNTTIHSIRLIILVSHHKNFQKPLRIIFSKRITELLHCLSEHSLNICRSGQLVDRLRNRKCHVTPKFSWRKMPYFWVTEFNIIVASSHWFNIRSGWIVLVSIRQLCIV